MAKTPSIHERLIGQIVGGRYEVVRLIAKGGMGSIYEVRNTRLGRSFAMKTLTAEAAADATMLHRFRREADVIARIKHPNIVEIVDWESLDDGSPAIVMEYLRGEDLSTRLEGGPVAWPLLARVADEMLAALSIAHANGVVHRDLKPQNVFLALDDAGDERVKLLDFGVSKVRDSGSLVTSDEHLLGTPAYMSPEQADGRASDVGTHSDVWALGAILHEMATGGLAFSAPSVPSILYKICHGSPASLIEARPDAPAAFVELVAATLEQDIDRRIADATVLRARLREALRDVAGVQFPDPLPRSGTPETVASNEAVGVKPSVARFQLSTADMGAVSVATSSVKRRTRAWVALAIAGLAATLVVIAIVLATRGKPARSAGASPATATQGGETAATADAGVAVESEIAAPLDAAIALESPAEPVRVPARDGVRAVGIAPAKPTHGASVTNVRGTGGATLAPANVDPPKVEPPRVEPKKKPCAKDDVECLYGDGT